MYLGMIMNLLYMVLYVSMVGRVLFEPKLCQLLAFPHAWAWLGNWWDRLGRNEFVLRTKRLVGDHLFLERKSQVCKEGPGRKLYSQEGRGNSE